MMEGFSMDKHKRAVTDKLIERTVKALCANNYDAHYIQSPDALVEKLAEYLPEGASCSVGGSMTLFETGAMDYLKSREDLEYYDRYAPDANIPEVFYKALGCDVYLTSSNAITEDGLLYNVDGTGNRVAALTYGPKKVVVIAGVNKLVKDLEQARLRMREVAAPANCVRLNLPNPCVKTGHCMDCRSDTYICVTEVVTKRQRVKNRIAVLILPDEYGY